MEFTNDERALTVLEIGHLIGKYKSLPIYEHFTTMEGLLRENLSTEVDNENTNVDISAISRAAGRLYTLKHKCIRHIAALEKMRTALTNEYFEEDPYSPLQKTATKRSLDTCKEFIAVLKTIHISTLITSFSEPVSMHYYSIPEEAQN